MITPSLHGKPFWTIAFLSSPPNQTPNRPCCSQAQQRKLPTTPLDYVRCSGSSRAILGAGTFTVRPANSGTYLMSRQVLSAKVLVVLFRAKDSSLSLGSLWFDSRRRHLRFFFFPFQIRTLECQFL